MRIPAQLRCPSILLCVRAYVDMMDERVGGMSTYVWPHRSSWLALAVTDTHPFPIDTRSDPHTRVRRHASPRNSQPDETWVGAPAPSTRLQRSPAPPPGLRLRAPGPGRFKPSHHTNEGACLELCISKLRMHRSRTLRMPINYSLRTNYKSF